MTIMYAPLSFVIILTYLATLFIQIIFVPNNTNFNKIIIFKNKIIKYCYYYSNKEQTSF